MAQPPPELLAHREWLGQIQQVGLVVSPIVLVKQGIFADRQKGVDKQTRLRELAETPFDFPTLAREILEWPDGLLAGAPGGPQLPDSLTVALPNYDDRLSPTYAMPAPVGQASALPTKTDGSPSSPSSRPTQTSTVLRPITPAGAPARTHVSNACSARPAFPSASSSTAARSVSSTRRRVNPRAT